MYSADKGRTLALVEEYRKETETILSSVQSKEANKVQSASSTWNPEETFLSDQSLETEEIPEAQFETEDQVNTKLIRITRPFRTKWDLLTMILALYNCFTIPFFIAFYRGTGVEFIVINTLIDVVFLADVVLNFFTTYIDRNGDEVLDHKKITKSYLRGNFWLDLVASIPIDNFIVLFSQATEEIEIIQLSDLLKLVRILRLGRIIRFSRTRDDVKATMKLLQLTLYLFMWVHCSACLWFVIVRSEEEWIPVPDFLTGTTTLYQEGIWRQYFTCFYHAVWLLVGGEVGPRNAFQAFFASIMFIAGALITAVLFGEMAVLMSNLNRRQTQFQEILDGALTTMHNMKLPQELTNKILDYITSTQSSLSAQEEYETFQKFISPSLQQEVSACIYDPIISMNEVLKSESRLTKMLVHKLNNKFAKPEEEIIIEGSEGDSLYFLVNGEVQVQVTDRYKKKHNWVYLYPGAQFGEIALVYNTPRTATVIGIGYTTIAELSRKDYESLKSAFHHLEKKLRDCTKEYNDPWKKFLMDSLENAQYLERLPSDVFSELVYFMEVIKVEKGGYLFKPGDISSTIYLVAEGELELSVTINEKHIHMLKKQAGFRDMESPPKIPKKNSELSDFQSFKLDVKELEGLKSKAEVVPVFNEQGVSGSVRLQDEVPAQTCLVGDYPQEIILEYLEEGALLYPNFALTRDPHQLQCKATKTTTIYALNLEQLEVLFKDHPDFKKVVDKVKLGLQNKETLRPFDLLDYKVENQAQVNPRMLWKSAILRTIMNKREERRKGSSQIASIFPKLQAIIACEEAGNLELAEKVIRGEIPPHYIQEDGTLDPAAINPEMNSSLPRSHPIMKTFKGIFDSITQPGGNIVKQYNSLERTIVEQTKQIDEFETQLTQLKNKLLKILEDYDKGASLPPVNRGVPQNVVNLDVEKANKAWEERKKARMEGPSSVGSSQPASRSGTMDLFSFVSSKKE